MCNERMVLRIERLERKSGKTADIFRDRHFDTIISRIFDMTSNRCIFISLSSLSGTFFPLSTSPLPTFRPRCLGPPVVVPITRYYRSGGTTTTTRPAITYPPRRKRGWRKREKEIQPQGNDIRRGDMPPRYIYLYGLAPSVSDVDNEPRTVVSWGRQR